MLFRQRLVDIRDIGEAFVFNSLKELVL
jgi:hypothetical protein